MNATVYYLRATRDCQDPWWEYRTLSLLRTARGRVRKFRTLEAALTARADLNMRGCWEVVYRSPGCDFIYNEGPARPAGRTS